MASNQADAKVSADFAAINKSIPKISEVPNALLNQLLKNLKLLYKKDKTTYGEILKILKEKIKEGKDYETFYKSFNKNLLDAILKQYEVEFDALSIFDKQKIRKQIEENINKSKLENLDIDSNKRAILLAIASAKEIDHAPKTSSMFLAREEFIDAANSAHRDYLSTPYKILAHGKKPKYYDFVSCEIVKPNGEVLILNTPGKWQKYMEPDQPPPDSSTLQFKKIQPPDPLYTYEIEKAYGGKLKNVIYRTNHGFNHSMRVSAIVPMIHSFLTNYGTDKYIDSRGVKALQEEDVKRVQLMMLYSVAGREDEMGWSDSFGAGNFAYQRYRSNSAIAFFEHCKNNRSDLYDLSTRNGKQKLYHDALMIELMGYQMGNSKFPDVLNPGDVPPLKIIEMMKKDYKDEIMKSPLVRKFIASVKSLPNLTPKQQQDMIDDKLDSIINQNIYKQFPVGLRNAHLDLVNAAHSHDLMRCFLPTKGEKDWTYGDLNAMIQKSTIGEKPDISSTETLKGIIDFFQYAHNLLSATGDSHMTEVEMDPVKIDKIINEFQKIEENLKKQLKDNPNLDYREELQKLAMKTFKENEFLKYGTYGLKEKAFNFSHFKTDHYDPSQRDHERDVISVANALDNVKKPTFYKGIQPQESYEDVGKFLDASHIALSSDNYMIDNLKKMQDSYVTKRYQELSKADKGFFLGFVHGSGTHDIRNIQKEYLDSVLKQANELAKNKTPAAQEETYWLIKQALDMVEFSMEQYKKSKLFTTNTQSRLQTIIEEIRKTLPEDTHIFENADLKNKSFEKAKEIADNLSNKLTTKVSKQFSEHIHTYDENQPSMNKYPTYDPKHRIK